MMISNTTHACIVYRDENRSNILSNAANLLTESLFFFLSVTSYHTDCHNCRRIGLTPKLLARVLPFLGQLMLNLGRVPAFLFQHLISITGFSPTPTQMVNRTTRRLFGKSKNQGG